MRRTPHGEREADTIHEITLERTPCYGTCPVYVLTLRRDGSAEYRGYMFVERMGQFRGRVEPGAFTHLADCAVDSGIWKRRKSYFEPITDAATAVLTVRGDGWEREVRNYAGAAPAAHSVLESAVDAVAEQIVWELVEPGPDDVSPGI
jgi:hypothetical protein